MVVDLARLRRQIEPRVRAVLAVADPLLRRFASVRLVQSGVVLAAQTFMALFPLLIGFAAWAPPTVADTVVDTMRTRFGLSGDTTEQAHHLIASREDLQGGVTAIGLIVVLASATAFTRALQRVYEHSWAVPRMGLKGSVQGLEWLVGIVIYVTLLSVMLNVTRDVAPIVTAIRYAIVIGSVFLVWWVTPFLLLCGRVRMRSLVLSGALCTIVTLVAGQISTRVMPRLIQRNETQFGTIGAAFAIQSWLAGLGTVIVAAAILGALGAQAGGPLGRWIRGTGDRDGWRRAKRPGKVRTRVNRRLTDAGLMPEGGWSGGGEASGEDGPAKPGGDAADGPRRSPP